MSLHLSAEPPRRDLPIPDDKAHRANELAVRAGTVTESRAALGRDLREELEHPVHGKILEALRSRRLVLCGLLALALLPVLWWEWTVSRDIYAVTLPVSPWIPFLALVSVAFFASALLGEGVPAFSLGLAPPRAGGPDKATVAMESLFDRPRTRGPRGGPAPYVMAGIALAAFVEGFIYVLSTKRVELMMAAEEIPEGLGPLQVWLPVALYGIDIALGIPAAFVLVAGYHTLRLRRQRARFTLRRDQEITLQGAAVESYTGYLADFEAYSRWAVQQGRAERPLVPPCAALRALLGGDDGADPARTDATASERRPVSPGGTRQDDATRPPGNHGSPGPGEAGRDARVDELLNLVDEQIARSNRSI